MFTTRRRSWGDIPSLFGPDGEELERPWEQFLDTSGAQLVGQTKEGKDIFEKEIKGLPGMKLFIATLFDPMGPCACATILKTGSPESWTVATTRTSTSK